MDYVIYLVVAVVAVIALIKLYQLMVGKEEVVVRKEQRTPFKEVSRDKDSVTLSSTIEFANVGKQCAVIMDALVHPLLPFEQYDGIDARCKAELNGVKREDEYFEAVLIEKGEKIFINIVVKLTARKGLSLDEALSHMVDFRLDLLHMESGRSEWHYVKNTVVLTKDELSRATGVKMVED